MTLKVMDGRRKENLTFNFIKVLDMTLKVMFRLRFYFSLSPQYDPEGYAKVKIVKYNVLFLFSLMTLQLCSVGMDAVAIKHSHTLHLWL